MSLDPRETEHRLAVARAEARLCHEATVQARIAYADALSGWNRTQPVWTPFQQARAFQAASQADRTARAASGLLRRPITVSQMAKGMAGGNAKRGGGISYRRGAYSKAQAMEVTALRLREAAAATKLPVKP
jgi:hypothetical protein